MLGVPDQVDSGSLTSFQLITLHHFWFSIIRLVPKQFTPNKSLFLCQFNWEACSEANVFFSKFEKETFINKIQLFAIMQKQQKALHSHTFLKGIKVTFTETVLHEYQYYNTLNLLNPRVNSWVKVSNFPFRIYVQNPKM